MKLNVQERLVILTLLPKEGNFLTLKVIKDSQSLLGLSEEDFKEYEIVQEGDKVKWNEKGFEEKEIPLGDKFIEIVRDSLKKLDENNSLTPDHLSVYEKFIEK